MKTAAQPEIWLRARDFSLAQDTFAREADAFLRVAKTGDIAAIRAGVRRLGGTCKSCHDTFRAPEN